MILKPHEPVAERVLLPGDPGRALRLATQLIDGPRMLNHNRGLWGYSGIAADGLLLTIQSTGLGGPSAAAVVGELVALGARRLIRVGTAAGVGDTALGTLVVAEAALAADGASRALGAGGRVEADAALADALAVACATARSGAAAGPPGPPRHAGSSRRPTSTTPSARPNGPTPARSPATSRPRRCSWPRSITARWPAPCWRSRARTASGSPTTRSGRSRARSARPGSPRWPR